MGFALDHQIQLKVASRLRSSETAEEKKTAVVALAQRFISYKKSAKLHGGCWGLPILCALPGLSGLAPALLGGPGWVGLSVLFFFCIKVLFFFNRVQSIFITIFTC